VLGIRTREVQLWRNRDTEHREFMREIMLRNEKVWRGVLDGLDRNTQSLVEFQGVTTAQLADLREESRAQRDALLRVLDELKRDDDPSSN
jgi:hypothetical protein